MDSITSITGPNRLERTSNKQLAMAGRGGGGGTLNRRAIASVNLLSPITHEEPAATVELWALEDEISGLLRDLGGVRLRGAAADVHLPAVQLDEEQHV